MLIAVIPAKYGVLPPAYMSGFDEVFDDGNTMSFAGAKDWHKPNEAIPPRAYSIHCFPMSTTNASDARDQ